MTITLVHHAETVRGFVAKLAAAQRWRFQTCTNFAAAAIASSVPPPGGHTPEPSRSASSGAACNEVTPVIDLTPRHNNPPSGGAGLHVLLAALHPPEGPCGFELIRRLASLDGATRFVLLGEPCDATLGFSALCGGASALVLLPLKRAELLAGMRQPAPASFLAPSRKLR
jgi:hypothetical protein